MLPSPDQPANNHTPLRVAFIGGGINSAVGRAHFSALRLDGLFELVAGCFSRNSAINAESARRYGVAAGRVHPDPDTLIQIEAESLDAVIVLTPTDQHFAPVISALEAGLPVICEKALATTVADAERIREKERACAGFLVVTFNYTGYPALRELRALVRQGCLGTVRHFVAEMPQEGFLRRDARGEPVRVQHWRLHDGEIPTVSLDLGVHLHQILAYLLDFRPVAVASHHASCGNHPVIDTVSALVQCEGGVLGELRYGKTMLGERNGLRIVLYGDLASAEWRQESPEFLKLAYSDGRTVYVERGSASGHEWNTPRYQRFKSGHPAGYIEAFANLYADIHSALSARRRQEPWATPEVSDSTLAVEGLKFMQAVAEAARQSRWIQL